ncbi:MAG: CDGSH iron-sulfur domain-containing protein [Butyricimonas faecihominis]
MKGNLLKINWNHRWCCWKTRRSVAVVLFVRGGIPIDDTEGVRYELRNRVTLCRCGASSNKPFCDGTHVSIRFRDGLPGPHGGVK